MSAASEASVTTEASFTTEASVTTEESVTTDAETEIIAVIEPNLDSIYSSPQQVSLFCHRKIPDELYTCKIWDYARERLVTKWRSIFSKNFGDRWMWIDVVYDSMRNGWYKVFVHMWCETNRSLFMRSKVLAGEAFEPINWEVQKDSPPGSLIQVYKTGANFTFSKSERPKTYYMHTKYRCAMCVGIPTTCMCCEVDYFLCPNGGVVPGSY
jgi:hypothetical protein